MTKKDDEIKEILSDEQYKIYSEFKNNKSTTRLGGRKKG